MKKIKVAGISSFLFSSNIVTNLRENGFYPNVVSGKTISSLRGTTLIYSDYELQIDNSFIKAREFSSNCSALFIDTLENFEKKLFDVLLFSTGYTFAFANCNLFNKSIQLTDGLFVYHLNFEYDNVPLSDKNIKYNYIYEEKPAPKDVVFESDYINYFWSCPVFDKYFFLFKLDILNWKTFYKQKAFFINYSYRSYNNFKEVFTAVANRTRNTLSIYISKDLA